MGLNVNIPQPVVVANGGTGLTTGTSGGVPYFSSTTAIASSGALAQNGIVLGGGTGATPTTLATDSSTTKVLVSGGTNVAPSWQTVPVPTSSYEISNVGLSATVAANALTIALKQSDGSTNPSTGTAAGHSNANKEYVCVYAINNAGTVELAWSSSMYDDGSVVTTTAEGGAGAADSRILIYSTTARTGVASRLIGRLASSQTTAGTWASAISETSLWPFNKATRSTFQTFTASGANTYTTPVNPAPIKLIFHLIGGGGGGSGGGTADNSSSGGTGGNTTVTINSIIAFQANGGAGGTFTGSGGAGGTTTILAPGTGIGHTGGSGGGYTFSGVASAYTIGGGGGNGMFGGGGLAAYSPTGAGTANTGGGGAGGSNGGSVNAYGGAGGGSGGYIVGTLSQSLPTTITLNVGAAGSAGAAGTSGNAGGAGGTGRIDVEEIYGW
jgi:hypothetical protein